MLVVDQLRGQHSTGIFRVGRHTDDVNVVKAVGTPDVLMDTKGFTQAMAGVHRAIIGHNRYATKGAVNRNNAHPFEFDKVVGVHNGSLRSYYKLAGHSDFAVDSQALYNHIDKNGLRDMVNNCEGAMALVWWNKETNELNIFRNNGRPLFYGTTKDGVVMLGSEAGMIDWIADRNKIELVVLEEVTANHHMRFHMPKGCTVVPKPHMEKVEKSVVIHVPFWQPGGAKENAKSETKQATVGNASNSYSYQEVNQIALAEVKEERKIYEVGNSMTLGTQPGFTLTSDEHPGLTFFMCDTKNTEDFRKGDLVETICSGWIREKGRIYYFLMQSGMSHIPCDNNMGNTDTVGQVEEEEGQPSVSLFSPYGRPMEPKNWYRLYGSCAYCSGNVEPETAVATRDKSGYLCNECTDDASVVLNLC